MNKFILIIGCICMMNLATIRGHEIGTIETGEAIIESHMDGTGMTRFLVKRGSTGQKIKVKDACLQIEEASHKHESHESTDDHDHNDAYCEQMKHMCKTFGERNFKNGDTLILHCGEANVGGGTMYKRVQFVASGNPSKIKTQAFAKTNDNKWVRSTLVWKWVDANEVEVRVKEYIDLMSEYDIEGQGNNPTSQKALRKILQANETLKNSYLNLFEELNGNKQEAVVN